jgi:tetratricopeptide (TPR) repeat protein
MAINPDIADPKNPAGSDNVGKQLLMVGAVEESIRCFEAALKARPDSAQYNTDLGVACLQKKDYPRAMACFRRATQADPNFPEAFSIWAWLLATSPDEKIRNAPEAVKLATRACELTSYRNPAMLETLAIAYGESGRYDEAVKILRNAMELCSADANRQLMPLLQQKLSQYEARQSVREKSLIFPAYR